MIRPDQIHNVMKSYTIGDGEHIVVDLELSRGTSLVDARTKKRYLDCSSQYASLPLGWNHEDLEVHAEDMGFYAMNKVANPDFYSEPLADFVKCFGEMAPRFKHFFFVEGGSLAVENALKAAFDWKARKLGLSEEEAGKLDVIHLEQSFHGRSGYTLSITNTVPNKTALFPKFQWTRIKNPKIHFPLVDCEVAKDEEASLRQAEEALKSNRVAAIILEPIQGEGGDNHFTPRYFSALRELADKYEAMLILDEVQTGVGLTGKMWAYEHFGIIPDMISFGKKTQVCGFASTTRIDEVPDNVFRLSSRINSTWGGNLIDMIRFTHIAEIIQKDRLVEQAAVVGDYFLKRLREVPRITNVRGRGLMLAFDLETHDSRNEALHRMQQEMTILGCGERSIRIRPSLIFTMADADEAISHIRKAI